jgi:uncharacterized coiled-coil DUF342 family protein
MLFILIRKAVHLNVELGKCERKLQELRQEEQDARETYVQFCRTHRQGHPGHQEYLTEIEELRKKIQEKVIGIFW